MNPLSPKPLSLLPQFSLLFICEDVIKSMTHFSPASTIKILCHRQNPALVIKIKYSMVSIQPKIGFSSTYVKTFR